MKQENSESSFDFRVIKSDLDNLLTAIENKLEREWSQKYKLIAGSDILLSYLKIARNYYRTILFICSDSDDNSNRDLIYSLSCPPLNRTILEALFSVIYLLENFGEKVDLFDKALLKEQKDIIKSSQNNYSGIPKWDEYIEKKQKAVESLENTLQFLSILSESEKNNLEQIRYFPRVSKIIKRMEADGSSIVSFLKLLDDLHYRELSYQSHLEPTGVIDIGLFFRLSDKNKLEEQLLDFRSRQVWLATSLMLCLASEIELNFDYGLRNKTVYLWTICLLHNEISKEIYEKGYLELFNQ